MNTGNKYESGRDIAEIAKLVRKDLKAAFPGCKFSVRIERFSMGQAIRVAAKSGPFPTLVELRDSEDEYGRNFETLPAYRELEEKIQGMVRAYGYRDIDSQTDYYNVCFYDSVNLSEIRDAQVEGLQMERDEKAAAEAAVASAEAAGNVDAPVVKIDADAVRAAASTVEAAAPATLSIPMTGDAIADARNLLHARVEAAIDAGDVKAARQLLDAVKALY